MFNTPTGDWVKKARIDNSLEHNNDGVWKVQGPNFNDMYS